MSPKLLYSLQRREIMHSLIRRRFKDVFRPFLVLNSYSNIKYNYFEESNDYFSNFDRVFGQRHEIDHLKVRKISSVYNAYRFILNWEIRFSSI